MKSSKYSLNRNSVPTIFLENDTNDLECETESIQVEVNNNQERAEKEILFLRQYVATLEIDIETIKKKSEELSDMQSKKIQALTAEVNELKKRNAHLESDFVQFVIKDDPKVS